MEPHEINRPALERLATLEPSGGAVLSLYLNLEPSEVPTPSARRAELDALTSQAARVHLGSGLTHEQEVGLRSDLERVRGLLEKGIAGGGARAVAIFAADADELLEVYRLPHAVKPEVFVNATPFVEPLVGLVAPREWAVLLSSRRAARIFRGSRDELTEVARLRDDVHRRHSQGGWSQARYERGIDKEIHDHVVHACEALFDHHNRTPFDNLIIGGPREIWPEVEAALHPYLRERLAGQIEADVERATAHEVLARSKSVMEETAHRAEQRDLDRLDEGIGAGGRAAGGLDEVLAELAERRVERLLIEDGFRAPGAVCPSCGRLTAAPGSCPIDGAAMEPRDDIVEEAIGVAIAQGASVATVGDLARIGSHDSIGALLRY